MMEGIGLIRNPVEDLWLQVKKERQNDQQCNQQNRSINSHFVQKISCFTYDSASQIKGKWSKILQKEKNAKMYKVVVGKIVSLFSGFAIKVFFKSKSYRYGWRKIFYFWKQYAGGK